MIEKVLTFNDLTISHSEIYAAMGYGEQIPEKEITDLVDKIVGEARIISSPRYMYGIVPAFKESRAVSVISGVNFRTGAIIGSYLDGMEKACIFVTTAGEEYERYLQSIKKTGNILKEFIADSIGSVIAESCVNEIAKRLDEEMVTPHSFPYSPGYCAWDITEQQKLFHLFPEKPCGITLSQTSLMQPEKSISGFFALGERLVSQPYRCDICTSKNCYKRRKK